MLGRTLRWPLLLSGLLAITLLGAPGAQAAEPSTDDPVATVQGLLDALVAKDVGAIPAFGCAEKRGVVADRFDLEDALSGALGEGTDVSARLVAALLAGMTVTIDGRAVTLVSADGTTAEVAVAGRLVMAVDAATAREFLRQVLEASGEAATEEVLDRSLPTFLARMESGLDLADPGITLVHEDGRWLVCDDFGGVSTATPEPTPAPGASLAPMEAAAYASLLAAIPEAIRTVCVPDSYWQVMDLGPEPGEIAQADCDPDGSGGAYVSYSLFASRASMDAFYDEQLEGMRNLGAVDGPGCPEGPGEASWDQGRRFCYQPFGDDASMRWTHDALAITASAIDDEGDWAQLESFFASAGPVAP